MSTTRIQETLSSIVGSQLPEFIQSDNPTFVAFIEAYYKFLEQDQNAFELLQNARKYNDIDATADSFVQYFLKTYAPSLPANVLADQKFLVKKIKDLYEAKGSEISYKLLFRILFDTTVDVAYPFENVLRASDGKWQQKVSLRVEPTFGDIETITNRLLTYEASGVEFETPILRVKFLTTNLFEIFLDPNFAASSYTVGTEVNVYDGNVIIFTGIIRPTTTSFSIQRGGSGFKAGQIFTINLSGGVDTLIKIKEVTSAGAITKLQFINYGYNYTATAGNTITVNLDANNNISETAEEFFSATQGFRDVLNLQKILLFNPSDPERYFLEEYVAFSEAYSSTVEEFSFDDSVFLPALPTRGVPDNIATIQFTLGALARYPGSYYKNDSFLSELEVRLQDDQLYQPFAYQTITGIDIEEFFDIVKELLHPAGQKLFNKRELDALIDLSANLITLPTSNVFFEALSVVGESDNNILELRKLFGGAEENVEATENLTYAISKPFDEVVNNLDNDFFSLSKTIDVEQIFEFDPTSSERYFLEDYMTYLEDETIYTFTTITVIPQAVFVRDNVTLTITKSIIEVIPVEAYFLEDYVEAGYTQLQLPAVSIADDFNLALT